MKVLRASAILFILVMSIVSVILIGCPRIPEERSYTATPTLTVNVKCAESVDETNYIEVGVFNSTEELTTDLSRADQTTCITSLSSNSASVVFTGVTYPLSIFAFRDANASGTYTAVGDQSGDALATSSTTTVDLSVD